MATGFDTDVRDLALNLMEALDCPRSLTVAILLRYGEYDQITLLEADPSHYLHSASYFCAVAATDFLRKYDGFQLDVDPHAAAIEKWWWAEKECFKTNERLGTYLKRGVSPTSRSDELILSFIERVRKNVRDLIGDGPPPTWEGRFGPGATVTDDGRHATVPDKLSSTPSLTPSALFYLVPWTGTKWATASAELGRKPLFVRGNQFFSVNKTSRTRRGCAKEPSINGYYQLGLGRVMRASLMQSGIDLVNGQSVHRRVACLASRGEKIATIDLTSASDCACTNLVELVMPPRWFRALRDLRSPFTVIDGKTVRLEKFSSMGNGFTFELETTIFAAIAKAVYPECEFGVDLFVYGDDIIVPSSRVDDLLWALKFFGFTPNYKKTFPKGPFRESCGGDFFNGQAVRPYYLESAPCEPAELISLANGLRRLAGQTACPANVRSRIRRVWFRVLDSIPVSVRRCRGPEALGDLVIHDEQRHWETRVRSCIRWIRVYRPAKYREVRWDGFAHTVQLSAALYGVYLHRPGRKRSSPDGDDRVLHPRDSVAGYKVGWVPYS